MKNFPKFWFNVFYFIYSVPSIIISFDFIFYSESLLAKIVSFLVLVIYLVYGLRLIKLNIFTNITLFLNAIVVFVFAVFTFIVKIYFHEYDILGFMYSSGMGLVILTIVTIYGLLLLSVGSLIISLVLTIMRSFKSKK